MLQRQRGVGGVVGLHLLRRRSRSSVAARLARAPARALELRLLRPALERAQLLARGASAALGGTHRLFEVGLALLRVGQLRRAPRSAPRRRAAAVSSSLRVDLGQLVSQLRAALVAASACDDRRSSSTCSSCARVCARRPRADRLQALAGIGVGGLEADQRGARLVGDHRLRPRLALQVLDLLRARQHAGLLGVGRVEGDGELRDGVAVARHDDLAVRELAARASASSSRRRCTRLRASR